MFPPLPYLEWISGRPEEATYDLGSSDLRTSAHRSGVIPESLADLPDPDEEVTLRSQLADEYGVAEENVLVTAGATHANLIAESAALSVAESGDGDEDDGTPPQVLVEKPGYQPLVSTPGALGARVDRFIRPEEDDELSADRIAAAARSSFALAVTSNRHNPTGRLTTRERLSKAADAAREAGGFLLVDEVYGSFVTENPAGRAFGGVTAAGLDGAAVTGSLTKFYGLGGLRIGWLIGPEELLDAARDAAFHLPTVAEPSRALARRALHNRERLSEAAREHLRANHELLAGFAAAHEKLSGEVHDGSSYAFLAHEDADGDEVAEAAWEEGILVVPGRFFDDADGFRVALGREPDHVEAALDALSEVLASLSADD
ncbi:pyridoxal phosphate-dependent aminotransferase [Halogeometricum luteum]|uniref:Aminotransferase n=1 Tax=Halogeometricum luteum TaxID=2950537 RepID=A0ABU2FVK0_9EURY|nr:pyridoxal phosphate-dependent aminotransferase [Halogeometricum sp. S3BR5-2]MDS0292575.1 pyridoxal phosphate-dependent aminotransferase [Halogeometricum sp. S3BR5-2]